MSAARILIIEDDITLSDQVARLLKEKGFTTTQCLDGQKGLLAALQESFDLILLDILLPSLNGLAVLNQIRKVKHTPVMMITASGAEQERIEGYRKGADDYLPKPFNFTEMMLRIEALLRRSQRDAIPPKQASQLIIDELQLNRIKQDVRFSGHDVELTPIQFKLLWVLLENHHEVMTKAFLYQSVLNRPFSRYDRSLDMHISRVRKKLVEAGMPPERLSTLHGKGYRFS
ncbi:two-component system response regulator PfeR [Alteromonas sp. 76-1]|jgi:two-component system response regulator PfeR|uniref:Two component transcriptional regulator n=1 Tax=Alteromonas naphthalenivorans TaxID=715451 RepID=F5Z5D2_ALTNA|nr:MULTISPECIES: response regulator transcription factor [Alteromonas]AEF04858.1 two component transcriptional regulator [Alteromonas naphthalenivorans]VEL95370.1 two-component system response regulator PfeR [Alteromonas sp. 76-1]